ncbi:MAG: hypothetical protein AAGI11_14705 [Pseudomonadota bacterium]
MTFFKELDSSAGDAEVWALNPAAASAWGSFWNAMMSGPSELTDTDKTAVVAYLYGLHGCNSAFEASRTSAQLDTGLYPFLAEPDVELDHLGLDDKWLSLLRYLRKLCLDPHRLVQRDADAVLAAGWSEMTFTEAVDISAMVKYHTMVLFGHGAS